MRILATALCLLAGAACAADKPVPESILPPGMRHVSITLTRDQRAAVRESDRKRALPQKQFIHELSSPIGKGRLE